MAGKIEKIANTYGNTIKISFKIMQVFFFEIKDLYITSWFNFLKKFFNYAVIFSIFDTLTRTTFLIDNYNTYFWFAY